MGGNSYADFEEKNLPLIYRKMEKKQEYRFVSLYYKIDKKNKNTLTFHKTFRIKLEQIPEKLKKKKCPINLLENKTIKLIRDGLEITEKETGFIKFFRDLLERQKGEKVIIKKAELLRDKPI